MYHNLVFSGGSIRGIAHFGALQELIDRRQVILSQVRSVAGASAGSIVSLMIALRYSMREIWGIIGGMNMSQMVNPDLMLLLTQYGADTGDKIEEFISDTIQKKCGSKDLTFAEMFRQTGIQCTIVASCIETKSATYFNHINTPDVPVITAVRASISIPLFFTPVKHDGKTYVDGSATDDFPMHLFEDDMEHTVGIIICNDYKTKYSCLEEYFLAITNLFFHMYYLKDSHQYPENTIFVSGVSDTIEILSFQLDREMINHLRQCGVEAAKKFLSLRDAGMPNTIGCLPAELRSPNANLESDGKPRPNPFGM